jgi:hypothetical protein
MADNFGANPTLTSRGTYNYSDYYGNPPGVTNPNEPAPGMGFMEKWRQFLNGMGVSGKPIDPNATGATDPGGMLRYVTGAAPIAQPQASQADVRKVDNAITAGPGAMPNLVQSATDWFRGGVTPPVGTAAQAVAAPAAPPMGGWNSGQDLPLGAAPAAAGTRPPVAPMTAGQIQNGALGSLGAVPAAGTGGIMNTRTGAVMNLDTRNPDGTVSAPAAPARPQSYAEMVGAGLGARMQLKMIGNKQAADQAEKHWGMEYAGKAEQGAHFGAQAANENLRTAAALEHLKANPTDFGGAAVIASGRLQPQDKYSVPMGGVPLDPTKGPTLVVNNHTGQPELRTPTTRATEQTIKDTLTAHPELKGSRTAAIAALKNTGRYDITGLR